MNRIDEVMGEAKRWENVIPFQPGGDHTYSFKSSDKQDARQLLSLLVNDRMTTTYFLRVPSGDMVVTTSPRLTPAEAKRRMSAVHAKISTIPISDLIKVSTPGQIAGLIP